MAFCPLNFKAIGAIPLNAAGRFTKKDIPCGKLQSKWDTVKCSSQYYSFGKATCGYYAPHPSLPSLRTMRHILALYVSLVFVASASADRKTVSIKRDDVPCLCLRSNTCYHVESNENDNVRVMQSSLRNEKGKVYCVSSQPIKWVFGSNSSQVRSKNN